MDPYTAAGILAVAYDLGILNRGSKHLVPAIASALLGYGVGHSGADETEAKLERSEEARKRFFQESFMREEVLRQRLAQQAEELRMTEILRQAALAHAQAAHR